jgi:hypothetical protein
VVLPNPGGGGKVPDVPVTADAGMNGLAGTGPGDKGWPASFDAESGLAGLNGLPLAKLNGLWLPWLRGIVCSGDAAESWPSAAPNGEGLKREGEEGAS